jgi:hypothetical protein
MALVNQSEFAKLCGVSRKTVTVWKSRDWLTFVGESVDVESSLATLKKYRRDGVSAAVVTSAQPVTQPVTSPASRSKRRPALTEIKAEDGETAEEAAERIAVSVAPHSYEEARRIKENYLALLNQLEYDKESGAVVAVVDVASAVGSALAKVRTRLLAIPAEQAPRVHRVKTVAEVQDVLQEIITEALEELVSVGAGGRR